MKAFITEVVLVPDEGEGGPRLFSPNRCVIRVDDEAAGPYLIIKGEDDEPTNPGNEHSFYFCDTEDIDVFSSLCKGILAQAENASALTLLTGTK